MISGIDSNLVSTWANSLFSQLDSQNQGYIDKSGLQSALENISDSSTSVDDIFTRLDSDSDGKVTKDEMTTALQSLFAQASSRMIANDGRLDGPGGPGSMPPPPPREGNDEGFSKEELAGQLEEIGSTDSKRSGLISNIIENFEEADTNGDGKVSFNEAMAYDKANQTDPSIEDTSASAASEANNESKDVQMMKQIMKLLQAYSAFDTDANAANTATQLSVTA